MLRNGWFLCTQRGALNLDPAAHEHYKACLARIKPLIDSGKVVEAKEAFYTDVTNHPGTSKLSLFAVQQFAWNPGLKDPETLRNFLERLPYDPRAQDEDKIIKQLQKADRKD
jgi:hypothetical protein